MMRPSPCCFSRATFPSTSQRIDVRHYSGSPTTREPKVSRTEDKHSAKRMRSHWLLFLVLFLLLLLMHASSARAAPLNRLPKWNPRSFKCVQPRGINHHESFRREKLTNNSTLHSIKSEIKHTKDRAEELMANNEELTKHHDGMHPSMLPFLRTSSELGNHVTLPDALKEAAHQFLQYMYAIELYRYNLLNHSLSAQNGTEKEESLKEFNNFILSDLQEQMENTHRYILEKIVAQKLPINCAEFEEIYRAEPTVMEKSHLKLFLSSYMYRLNKMLGNLDKLFEKAITHENRNQAKKEEIMKRQEWQLSQQYKLFNLGHRQDSQSIDGQQSSQNISQRQILRQQRRRHPHRRYSQKRFARD